MPETFSWDEALGRNTATPAGGSLREGPAIRSNPRNGEGATFSWEEAMGGAPAPAEAAPAEETWMDWAARNVRNTADQIGLATGLIDPSTYRGYGDPNAQPSVSAAPPRGLIDRATDAAKLASGIGGQGEVGALNRALNDAFDWDDSFLAATTGMDAVQREAYRDMQLANQAKELQGRAAMLDAADPIMREGDAWYNPGTIARFGAQMAGDLAGNANPTYLLGPGSTWLRRAAAQGGINAGIDVGAQSEMLSRGIQEEYSPEQTAMQFVAGFGMQSLGEAIPAAFRAWRSRGTDAAGIEAGGPADGDLMDATLDGGPTGPAGPAASTSAAEELAQFDAFTESLAPELRNNPYIGAQILRDRTALVQAATAEQVANRGPQVRNIGPDILRERADLEEGVASGEMDPSYAPPPLPQRTMPEGVPILATQDGNVRADDLGGLTGLARDLEANQGILDQAVAAQSESPLLRYILEQNVGDRTKVGQILARMGELQQTQDLPVWRVGDQGNNPLDPAVNAAERMSAPTSPTMRELDEGRAGPYASPMATRGNRPFKDVPGVDDRPEARGPEGFGPPPEGTPPRAGRSYWEDRYQAEADAMVREWEASRARRQEERARQTSQEKDASQRYVKAGKTPAQDDAGSWRMTDDGIIADKDGNPVVFKDAKAAAIWATKNRMAGDFDLDVWGAQDRGGTQRIILKRKANSQYGQAKPAEPAAETTTTEGGALPPPRQESAPDAAGGTSSSLAGGDGVQGGSGPTGRATAPSDAAPRPFDADEFAAATRDNPTDPAKRGLYERTVVDETAPRAAKVRAQKYLDDMQGATKADTPAEAARGDTVEFANPKGETLRGKVARVRSTPEGRTVYDIDVPGRGLQNAFGDEARIVSDEPAPAKQTGDKQTVRTPAGREVEVQFELRELSELQQATGNRQPRDRSRDASDAQVNKIASDLDPEQLKGSRIASQGSPIIGPDGVIEVGNGRVRAIERAYEQFPERIEAYKQMLRDEGYDIEGMDKPVLVRKRLTEIKDDADMRAWVNEAQETGTLGMSAPEQAAVDAKALSNDTIGLYRGGDFDSAGNREFIKAFQQDTNPDLATFLAADGSLSKAGKDRVEAAMLARAFDEPTLIAKLTGDADDNIKAIGNVLRDTAGKFAQVKDAVADGRIRDEFDITKDIAEVASLISRARANGEKMADLLGQSDMFGKNANARTESVARLMFKDEAMTKPRSQARLSEALNGYLDSALKSEEGAGMFGDEMRAIDALEAVRTRAIAKENGDSGIGQGRMFRLETKPFGKKRPNLEETKRGARGSLNAQLARIVDADFVDMESRELAQRLLDFDETDVSLRRATQEELRTLDDGTIDRSIPSGVTLSGDFDPRTSEIRVASMADTETILHEAIHARLIRRYGIDFAEATVEDLASGDIAKMVRLYNDARERFKNYGWVNKKLTNYNVKYALTNVDEFIANALTVPAVKRWLQKGTLWDQFVDIIRSTLGLPKRLKPMLDDVLRTGRNIVEKAKEDAIRFAGDESGALNLRKLEVGIDKDGVVNDIKAIGRAFKNPGTALKRPMEMLTDAVSWGTFTTDGRLRVVAKRFDSQLVNDIADMFHAPAGKGDKAVSATFHEAVQKEAVGRSQQVFRALEPILDKPASLERVANLLRYPKRTLKASPAELEAAKQLREALKDVLEYRKDAGEDIGEVADGYFPRWLNIETVIAQSDKFKQAATKLYMNLGESRQQASQSADNWFKHVLDSYAGLDGGLDVYGPDGDSVGTRTAQARQFGKEADTILADFYQNDPMEVLTQYMFGAARRAEMTRRFGKKGREGSAERKAWEKEHGDKTQKDVLMEQLKEELGSQGERGAHAISVIRNAIGVNLGQINTRLPAGTRVGVAWAHTIGQLGTMDRATITSLNELMMGFTRGGLRRGLPFIKDSMVQYYRQMKKAPPDDARRWAEALGIAHDAVVNTALTARASIEMNTKASATVLQKFYEATTLHQYTEGTRIAATKMGKALLDTWAGDLQSKSPRVRNRAERYMKELGISDPQAMGKALRKGIDIDEVRKGSSELAKEYGNAIIRFTNQTIMRPTRAEKPVWSSHPVGSMMFSLLSYTYGFNKNVLFRAGRMAKDAVKYKDPTLLMPAAGLVGVTAFSQVNYELIREGIFGGSDKQEDLESWEELLVALDRAGLTGAASPAINAMTGARYRRSMAESLVGPVIGRPLELADASAEAVFANSEKTNTTERKLAGALYDVAVEPAIDAYAAVRGGQIVGTGIVMGTGVRYENGLLPSDREAFISAVAGEKEEK